MGVKDPPVLSGGSEGLEVPKPTQELHIRASVLMLLYASIRALNLILKFPDL